MARPKLLTSQEHSLIKEDFYKWSKNSMFFGLVLAVLILFPGLLRLIPTNTVWGGIILYAGNLIFDLAKKWYSENRYTVNG